MVKSRAGKLVAKHIVRQREELNLQRTNIKLAMISNGLAAPQGVPLFSWKTQNVSS
jgi:hypothetical protein